MRFKHAELCRWSCPGEESSDSAEHFPVPLLHQPRGEDYVIFVLQDREEPRLAEGISCSRFCHAWLSGPRTAEIRPRHILQKLRDLGHGLVSRCHLEQENITRKGLANCAQGMSTACFLLHCCSDNPDISSHSSVSYKTNRQAQN